jgi:sensor histidine kinase YesM
MNRNKTFIDSILQNRILSHAIFWLFFLVFSTTIAALSDGRVIAHLIKYLSILPSQMLAAYILVYFQVSSVLMKRQYALFVLSFAFTSYFFSALARFSVVHIAEPFFRKDFEQETILEILSDTEYLFTVYFPSVYTIAFLMLIVHSAKRRSDQRRRIELLEKEKAMNELKFLKAQIQPHFLFNTLNNLYALTLAKSDLAPEVVLKLSEILDFILYQSNQSEIPIEKEIELIQGFIDLETLRYGDLIDVTFEHELDTSVAKISPLILLPFVENAFKHGASGNLDDPMIKVRLKVENDQLLFSVFNNKPKQYGKKKETLHGGIGIKNLKRQLQLNYAQKHTLDVQETDNDYHIHLTLELS